MGNAVSFVTLVMSVALRRIHFYLFGRITQGPVGLSLDELQELEKEFQIRRRYGHRLEPPLDNKLKVLFVGGSSEDAVDAIVLEPSTTTTTTTTTSSFPPFVVLDQLHLGCNTVNAVAFLISWFLWPIKQQWVSPSRLHLYYVARDDTIERVDDGVSFHDVFAYLNLNQPLVPEDTWPYSPFTVNMPRAAPVENDEFLLPFTGVQLLPTLANLIACVQKNGPFVAAVSVSEECELNAVYRYDVHDKHLGYQPLVFISFQETTQSFTAVNSFGPFWGTNGGTVTCHAAELLKDPAFTSAIYTFVPDLKDELEQ